MQAITASHATVVEVLVTQGQAVPWQTKRGRNVRVALEGDQLVVRGTGLNESINLAEVERVGMYPGTPRFGLAAPTTIDTLIPEPGMLMLRIDAKVFGRPKRHELAAFARTVERAVENAQRSAGRPPREVAELQHLYANRVAFGAHLLAEYEEIDRVYGMLRQLGYDADQALVDAEKAKNAEWMAHNPWMTYYEPHLDPDRFDSQQAQTHADGPDQHGD